MAVIEIVDSQQIDRADEVLTPDALEFVARLHELVGAERAELLAERSRRRAQYAADRRIDFDPATAAIRGGAWQVASTPPALRDRRVEITGPASPAKMAINALNSGAKVWLADLEDAATPSWHNVVDAQVNLADASRRRLSWSSPEGKHYRLREDAPLAVVVVRPRGWHLDEDALRVDGEPAIGALVDFGLYFFHNAATLLEAGLGPYFYLPKLEHHLEARLWARVFAFAEQQLGIPAGSIRATVLIETIPAAFQMEEILYELRDYASGLNAGRWDYLFSIIKVFRDAGPAFVLPDRASVTMTAPFMRAYTELLVASCHAHGAAAIGGMAAAIPNRREPETTARALANVRADKRREAGDGFDGSWVAHPDLVEICREEFDAVLGERPNQIDRVPPELAVTAEQLLDISSAGGQVTEAGLRSNLYVAVAYLGAWLSGSGAAAIRGLMEDVATAEISRSQVWQWLRNFVVLADTERAITPELVRELLVEESERVRLEVGDDAYDAYYAPATAIVESLCLDEQFVDFLTLPAYRALRGSSGMRA